MTNPLSRIAFATASDYPHLTLDDQLVVQVGNQFGLTIEPAIWNDPSVVWRDFDAVVIRSCWDYHHQPETFLAWVTMLEQAEVVLWNPPAVIYWNHNKQYLLDLEQWGVPVVPTLYLPQGASADLPSLLATRGWADVVIKPAISASAFNTWRATSATEGTNPARFATQLHQSPTLIQPYMPEIEAGEWSLIYFNGQFSHAALKLPKAGDFRVQGAFGGASQPALPDKGLIEQGATIIAHVQAQLEREFLYIRVDGIVIDGRLVIMELELIEPSLFIAFDEQAAARFAQAMVARLSPNDFISAPSKAQ
jgi:glutathione synthase/RimK-type ligase-like ATP-grasp enzyme